MDLQTSFMPKPKETEWVEGFARTPDRRLGRLVTLKCVQFVRHLVYFEMVRYLSCTSLLPIEFDDGYAIAII